MSLDKFYTEKAKNELRETEARKCQSLQQFRDWLAKHPFLSKVRQDDIHLLQFLRARKFNISDATQTFERYYIARKRFPQFAPSVLPALEECFQMLNSGAFYPLPGRDREGCRIVLLQSGKLDMDKYNIDDGIKYMLIAMAVLMEEEETQICGMKIISDHQGLTRRHFLPLNNFMDYLEMFRWIVAGRQKGSYVVNLPSIANFFGDIAKLFLSEKLKKRFFLHRNYDELIKSGTVDVKMLPKEFGGIITEAEMLDEFKNLIIERYGILQEIATKGDIDWSKVSDDRLKSNTNEAVGSFRKLEVD